VFGGVDEPADRLDFLNSVGDYASDENGVTVTGLDDVDFWMGGLAERQMPFGGLLGSTFNFVFETQMEALQNHDRFYYLSRTAGMHFGAELENNSFAKLIMRNTDALHLPADVFSTPGFILEVDPSRQFNAGLDGADPEGGTALTPWVIRDNPLTAGPDDNYLRYTGPEHVVLGGTDGDDIMIASEGDDTLWGDAGNDRLEGGDGVDNIEGGLGDDIITDWGGDDVLKGNEGNDVIHGGNGLNILFGGDGSDFIITGEDVSDTFGGKGNDFIYGAQMNLPTFGNEGDDWIEIGTSDGAGGDNFDPQEASEVIGHDVFITGGGFDEADGEGGDDMMVFSDGEDHFGGGGGFDWALYKNDPFGVTADLNVNDLIEPLVTPSNQGILDRFAEVEGLSGSKFSDVLRGDDADVAEIVTGDALDGTLFRIDLIDGLQEFLDSILQTGGVTSFTGGNIILGGEGSDVIEGRGGDDLIDGDLWMNVRIAVTGHPTITSADSMVELIPYMLSGEINPSQLSIAREIITPAAAFNFDTAVYTGPRANYTIAVNGVAVADTENNITIGAEDIVTITDNTLTEGVDQLRHIERLQFSDLAIVLRPGINDSPVGTPTLITDGTPAVGETITVNIDGVTDGGTPISNFPVTYIWQVELDAVGEPGVFTDLVDETSGNPTTVSGSSFEIPPDVDGLAIRAKVVYRDANDVIETVYSAPTAPIAAGAPTVVTPPPAETPVTSEGNGVHLIRADRDFILQQI